MQCPHSNDQLGSCCTIATCATVRVAHSTTTAGAYTTSGEVYVRYTPTNRVTGDDNDPVRLPLFLLLHQSHRVRDVVLHERRRNGTETRQRSGNDDAVLMSYRGALHFFPSTQQLACAVAEQTASSAVAEQAVMPAAEPAMAVSSQEAEARPQEASLTLVFASSTSSQRSVTPHVKAEMSQTEAKEEHDGNEGSITAVEVKQEAGRDEMEDDGTLTLQLPLTRIKQETKSDDDDEKAAGAQEAQMRLKATLMMTHAVGNDDTAPSDTATRRVLRLGAPAVADPAPLTGPRQPMLPVLPLTPAMALCVAHDRQLIEEAHLVPYVLTMSGTMMVTHETRYEVDKNTSDDDYVLEGIAFSYDVMYAEGDERGATQQRQQLQLVSAGTPRAAPFVHSIFHPQSGTTSPGCDGRKTMAAQSESTYALLVSPTRFTAAALCPLVGLVLSHQPQTATLAVTYPDETSVTALQSQSPELVIEPLTRLPTGASGVRAALLLRPAAHNTNAYTPRPFDDSDTEIDQQETNTPCQPGKAALCHGCYVRTCLVTPEMGGRVAYYFFRSEACMMTWLHRCVRRVWRLCGTAFADTETSHSKGDMADETTTDTTLTLVVTNENGRLLALQGGVDATRDVVVVAADVLTAAASSQHGGLRVTLRALVALISALCTCFLLRHATRVTERTDGEAGRCTADDDMASAYEEDVRSDLLRALAHAFALTHAVHVVTTLHTTLRQEGEREVATMLSAAMHRVLGEEGNALRTAVQYHAHRLQHEQERGVSRGSCRPAFLSCYERYALRLHQTLWLLSCTFASTQLQPPCAGGMRRVWLAMLLSVGQAQSAMTTLKATCSLLCALRQRVVLDTGPSIFDLRLISPQVQPRSALLLHFVGDVDVMVRCVQNSSTHLLCRDRSDGACAASLDVTLRWVGRRWPLSLATRGVSSSAGAPCGRVVMCDAADDLGGLGHGAVVTVPLILLLFRVVQHDVADDATVRLDTTLPFCWQLPALSCLRGQTQQITFAVPHIMSSDTAAGARDTPRARPSRKRGRLLEDEPQAAAVTSSTTTTATAAVCDATSVLCVPVVVHDEAMMVPLVMPRLRPAPTLREYVTRALPGCPRTVATLAAVLRYMAAHSIIAVGYDPATSTPHSIGGSSSRATASAVRLRGRWCRTALNELLGSCVVELRAHARRATECGVGRRYSNRTKGKSVPDGAGAQHAKNMPWALAVMRAALELPALVRAVQDTIEACLTQNTDQVKRMTVCSTTVQTLLWRVVLEHEVATAVMGCLMQDAAYAAEHAGLRTQLLLHDGAALAPNVSPEWQEIHQAVSCALSMSRARQPCQVTVTRQSIQAACHALLRDCLYAMNLPSGAGRKTHALALPLELCLLRHAASQHPQQEQQQQREGDHVTTVEALDLLSDFATLT